MADLFASALRHVSNVPSQKLFRVSFPSSHRSRWEGSFDKDSFSPPERGLYVVSFAITIASQTPGRLLSCRSSFRRNSLPIFGATQSFINSPGDHTTLHASATVLLDPADECCVEAMGVAVQGHIKIIGDRNRTTYISVASMNP